MRNNIDLFSSHPELVQTTGLDKVISFEKNKDIIQGNAEHLPFPARSFDIVLNVESSHLYTNINKFLEEVYRVLKPDGYFCWADLRQKNEVDLSIFYNVYIQRIILDRKHTRRM